MGPNVELVFKKDANVGGHLTVILLLLTLFNVKTALRMVVFSQKRCTKANFVFAPPLAAKKQHCASALEA